MIVLWFLCGLPLVLGEKNCCLIKRVLSGPLEGVYDLKGKRQEKEDCMDDCVYTRDVDGEDYCFSSVPNFPVECTDKDGKFVECTNPNPPYPNNSPCKLPDGRTKNGTCCGIVSHKKMISANGICYPPGTQCVDNATNSDYKLDCTNPGYSPCNLTKGGTHKGYCCPSPAIGFGYCFPEKKDCPWATEVTLPPGACNQILCKNDHGCEVNNCGQCVKGRCTDKKTGLKYLGSDLLWLSCTVGWRECHIDEDVDGNKIVLGSTTYEKGLYAHANSSIQFSLDGKFDRFHSCIGIDKRSDCPPATRQGNARFRVIGDGDVLRGWQRKKGGEDAVCFQISVSGINVLRLETDDGGNTYECDHTAWADAYVYNTG